MGPGFKELPRPMLSQRAHSQLWFLDHWSTKKTKEPLGLPLGDARCYLSPAEAFKYIFMEETLKSYAVFSLSLNTSSQQISAKITTTQF